MFTAAPPAKPTDKSFTKSSFLIASLGMQNCLNWVLTFDNAQEGADLEGILALLMNKNDGMDIMLVRYLLLEHSLSVAFGNNGKTWNTFVKTWSRFEGPDEKLVYGLQGIGEKATKI